jgi:hypothetical protein
MKRTLDDKSSDLKAIFVPSKNKQLKHWLENSDRIDAHARVKITDTIWIFVLTNSQGASLLDSGFCPCGLPRNDALLPASAGWLNLIAN